MDVDTAVTIPVNKLALIDNTDFISTEEAIAYNETNMDLIWHFVESDGTVTHTAVTPTTGGGDYDWAHGDGGIYEIGMPASGGASANNDTEGYGWFTGLCDGVLAWCGPTVGFRAAALNDALCDGGDTLDVNVTAMAANVLTAAALAADAGAEIAALVETYIVNEGDATAVMQAIADLIAADWVAGDASPLAIASAVRTELATELSRIDEAVSAAKTLTAAYDSAKTAAQAGDAMTLTALYDAAKTASQAGDQMALTDAQVLAVADALIGRSVSTAEATAAEHSLCTLILAALESAVEDTTWTIKRTDGTTTHATKTVTKQAGASPITGVS